MVFNMVSGVVISANHLMKEEGEGFFMAKNPSIASRLPANNALLRLPVANPLG